MFYKNRNKIGDGGEHFVAYSFTHYLGWVYRQLPTDLGIDGEIEIIEKEESTAEFIKVQVKSSMDLDVKKNGLISYSIDKEHIAYWKMLPVPVVLCLVDLKKEKHCVYFKFIDDSVSVTDGDADTQTIEFDPSAIINAECAEVFLKFIRGFKNINQKKYLQVEHFSFFQPYINLINKVHNILINIETYKGTTENSSVFSSADRIVNSLATMKNNNVFWGQKGIRIKEKIEELEDIVRKVRSKMEQADIDYLN